ncbi:MAG: VWA domain-containing protein [Acidobacteria bacterium]|nr:VWA domain-containing protein [Acidobacteriota bacterium]
MSVTFIHLRVVASLVLLAGAVADAGPDSPAVRITSPLGRTGLPGAIRIVAQVKPADGQKISAVRFTVDGELLGTLGGDPPFALEWADKNPFERREIVVEAEDDDGDVGRDTVVLDPIEVRENTEVTSVLVEAGVYDAKGRVVRNLTASEFRLEEDGVVQDLDMVTPEVLPTYFALLVDSSQSMWRNIEFVRAAAARLGPYLRPRDRVIVAPFSKAIKAITGPTNDRPTIDEAIAAIRAEGGTAMRDALLESVKHLEGVQARRVAVLITDAYDEHSRTSLDAAIDAARAAEVTVYTVGIGGVAGISLRGQDELKAIATRTGGRSFFPARPEGLGEVYDILASDAQLRYLITYTPKNQRRDGTWRNVSLRTYAKDMLVKARTGYFAPDPLPVKPSLEFTAMDLDSRFLDLTADDLIILEDGVEQKVETFHEATAPVSLVLALDTSGSMKRSSPKVVEAAVSFVEALRSEDNLGVITFADRSVVAHGVTDDRSATIQTLQDYLAIGGTALYDALCDSLLMLKQRSGRRALVVLTDGRDEDNPGTGPGSVRAWEDVLHLLQQVDATVFAVGLGTKLDQQRLVTLASQTGGQAYFPEEVGQLASQYERIIENLRHRYIVSYTSTNSKRDGRWRAVEIRARSTGVVVSSRSGYFAPDR